MDGSDGRTDQWRGREELELLNHFKSRESPGTSTYSDRMDESDGRTDQWRGREELELLNHFKSRESPGAENTVRSEVPGGTVPGRYWYEYMYRY